MTAAFWFVPKTRVADREVLLRRFEAALSCLWELGQLGGAVFVDLDNVVHHQVAGLLAGSRRLLLDECEGGVEELKLAVSCDVR